MILWSILMPEFTSADLESITRSLRTKGRLIPIVTAQATLENNENTRKRDTNYLHPSEICKRDWCPRASMYEINNEPMNENAPYYSFQTLNIFKTGHDIHAKWQGWLERSGLMKQAELPIFNEECHIKGSADGLIEDFNGEAILEIKSVGTGTVRLENFDLYKEYDSKNITIEELWKKIRQPFSTHLRQINLYMYATGVHQGIILYEWKASQAVKEFEVKYQSALIEHILAAAQLVKKHLEQGTIIDRPIWATEEHRICKKCPYNTTCWSNNADRRQVSEQPGNEELFGEILPSKQAERKLTRDSKIS